MGKKEFKPAGPKQRTLGTLDLTLIWFGAAIAITEIWGGGLPQLTGLGLAYGLLAIVIGRIIGNGMMALMARVGAESGLPTMVLTRPVFGARGSYLPALFNMLQLVGWTGWMLFVSFLYLDILAKFTGLPTAAEQPAMRFVWIILLGALCTLWAYGGQRFWRIAERIAGALLFILTIAMTAVVLQHYDISALWQPGGRAPTTLLAGADLVIAMSVSWLPLVADYSRFAKKVRSGAWGTFWGYFVGGVWMYATGLLVALATQTNTPDQMVITVMGGQSAAWALAAIVLVLLSTVTTTFLDIYSAVISTQNLLPRFPERWGNLIVGALGVIVALGLDVFAYQPFLEAIGAIFLPAFSVVLAEYFICGGRNIKPSQLAEHGGVYWYSGGYNWRALAAWLAGFLVYDWARGFSSIGFFAKLGGHDITSQPFAFGASLPCIVVSVIVYLVLRSLFRRSSQKEQR